MIPLRHLAAAWLVALLSGCALEPIRQDVQVATDAALDAAIVAVCDAPTIGSVMRLYPTVDQFTFYRAWCNLSRRENDFEAPPPPSIEEEGPPL